MRAGAPRKRSIQPLSWQYPEGRAVGPRFAADAVAEAREGKTTDDKVVTQDGGREPWRGEAQEGNGLERGLTAGRGVRALCREQSPEGEASVVRCPAPSGHEISVPRPDGNSLARDCPGWSNGARAVRLAWVGAPGRLTPCASRRRRPVGLTSRGLAGRRPVGRERR